MHGTCPICGDPSKFKKGFCKACYAWHYATCWMTPSQAASYAERFKTRLYRATARLPIVKRMGFRVVKHGRS